MEEKIKEIMSQEDFTEKLLACETPEQVQALFASKGLELTEAEVRGIGMGLRDAISDSDELDEESLDFVAGGAASFRPVVSGVIQATIGSNRFKIIDKSRLFKAFRRW